MTREQAVLDMRFSVNYVYGYEKADEILKFLAEPSERLQAELAAAKADTALLDAVIECLRTCGISGLSNKLWPEIKGNHVTKEFVASALLPKPAPPKCCGTCVHRQWGECQFRLTEKDKPEPFWASASFPPVLPTDGENCTVYEAKAAANG